MREKTLSSDVQFLKGVGPKIGEKLQKIGIKTIYDLLTYFPRAYEDRRLFISMGYLNSSDEGDLVTVCGTVVNVQSKNIYERNLYLFSIWLEDDTGGMKLTWFNQKYLAMKIHIGQRLIVTGKIKFGNYADEVTLSPIKGFDIIENSNDIEDFLHITPIYPLTSTVKQAFFRNRLSELIDELYQYEEVTTIKDGKRYWQELLSEEVREKNQLNHHWGSIKEVHFPKSFERLKKARRTLAFEELFLIQFGLLYLKKKIREEQTGIQHRKNIDFIQKIISDLPFTLTLDQHKVLNEILVDMESVLPMRRLIQGDVGSGKTIIAMLALANAVKNDYQGAMMMPTEILARQHFETFRKYLQPYGIRIDFLSGHLSKKQKEIIYQRISNYETDIVIGTHALIQDDVRFAKLGLVVTDEQHRFGVAQRSTLEKKSESNLIPDMLSMTATPIPRTLTLTVYGDLDVSNITELPPGRIPVKTKVVKAVGRNQMYYQVLKEIQKGRQAYVVCPRIEAENPFEEGMHPLDANGDKIVEIKLPSVEEVFEELSNGIFKNVNCGLLHGKMKPKDKDKIMEQFRDGHISLLISTTVIEVGVDVPNATVITIEHADRFGLAQLHQLRGRVGRSDLKSTCYLLSDSKSEVAIERLKTMEKSNDGFYLAEVDMKLRGPGQFFTGLQHGLPDLKMANVLEDMDLLHSAREAALQLINSEEDFTRMFEILNLAYGINFTSITKT